MFMSSKLTFGSKLKDDILLCDYCRCVKCEWVKATPRKYPENCVKPKIFEIADDYIPKSEFDRRVNIAKKISVYLPKERKWQFSIKAAGGLSGEKLREIIEEVNNWSNENNFELTEMIRYKVPKWF